MGSQRTRDDGSSREDSVVAQAVRINVLPSLSGKRKSFRASALSSRMPETICRIGIIRPHSKVIGHFGASAVSTHEGDSFGPVTSQDRTTNHGQPPRGGLASDHSDHVAQSEPKGSRLFHREMSHDFPQHQRPNLRSVKTCLKDPLDDFDIEEI